MCRLSPCAGAWPATWGDGGAGAWIARIASAPWVRAAVQAVRHGLLWVAHHTGLPVVVVAAVAIVLSWRLARRLARVAVEVAVTVALLLLATKMGWIHW